MKRDAIKNTKIKSLENIIEERKLRWDEHVVRK